MGYSKDALFQVVYSALTGAATLSGVKKSSAYASDASFPQVVLSPILTPKTSEGFFDNVLYEHFITIIIDVYATSSKQLDETVDKVDTIIGSIDWGSNKLRMVDSFQDYTNALVEIGSPAQKKNLHNTTITYTLRGFGSW